MERDEIAARLAGLSPAKRALLERRRRGEAAPAVPAATIGRRAGSGPAPLSFSQQRLRFLDELEPGSPTYNLRVLLRLSGPLDRRALARSFREVVRRHESLRTAFRVEAGAAVQVALPALELALPCADLAALPAARRAGEARRLARQGAARGFDLASPPLLRVDLTALGGGEHLLLVVMHHIVSDGLSMAVLVREVGALYEAFRTGRPSPLAPLPIQYADFAVWQRGWLAGEVLAEQLGYWRLRLAGAPAGLDLPADRPRPAVQSFRGGTHGFAFAPGLAEAVAALARGAGATPFMVMAAGLFALLARLGGQDDLSIGSPVANRTHRETDGLIGFFVNTLVLRADVGRARDFAGLLAQVREVTLGAYAHQEMPFEELVAELQPDRDLSRTPLFQVALESHDAPPLDSSFGGLELRPEELPLDSAKFDLAFVVRGRGGAVGGRLEYATDLYDAATAARLCGQWLRLLAAGAAAPEAELASLELLSAAERHQLLAEWNDTGAANAGDALLLHQLFEAQVDRDPLALAAVCAGEPLTYGELEARANRLASLLAALGAGPGAPVAIWMDRSLDLLTALLGASKAGAAYLPIDAGWPAERARAVLAGTAAGIVVTRARHLPAVQRLQWELPRLADAVCLDVDAPEPPPEPLDAEGVRDRFDAVSEQAVDWVTAAGFWSSYTGEPFAEAEVLEYRDRVASLAAPWLGADARVLEIGCGSGLVLWELAPCTARYVGLDPSARTQERNRERARAEGGRAELVTGFAHEIETLAPGPFDLVILPSTVQFFPGLAYLERVLAQALSLLAPGGAVVVADVMDPRRREELQRSLAEHAAAHPESAAARSGGRAGSGRELYVDEGFFADLAAAQPGVSAVRVLPRTGGFLNELRFRYDVVIERAAAPAAAAQPPSPPAAGRSRRVWTGWHAARSPAGRPLPVAGPEDVAYVIHTSGSTGEPKGIVVQHRPAVELCRWMNSTYAVGPGDRILFVASPAFDLSVYDVFGVLGAGGAVHVAAEAEVQDAERLIDLLVREPVTIWDSAPAALQQLAPLFPSHGRDAEPPPLRLVVLSGDWIPVPLPDLVRAAFPRARVMAQGGATEATVWSNWYPVGAVDPRWPSIPYGRPIANARYHVLDRALRPCPIGVPGDLHIGGDCLCVGYARLPGLTAERFLPDPFALDAGAPGARLYATGDRARYFVDGNLEFLGRVDSQVKIRGYRIELEEIEAVLARQPGVREAAVVAREDVPGAKRLVGYVVPSTVPAPTPAELRAALARAMPDYMVPWTFVAVDRMPLTANGKLDRKALPAPRETAETAEYVAPRSDLERAVAVIWQEVLGLPRVGVSDNFFELGGSSLVVTQVISRVREALGVELPMRALFETRTLAALAARIEAKLEESSVGAQKLQTPAVPPLTAAPRGGPLPLSFAQQRLWFFDQLEPGSPLYNVPGAVRLAGPPAPARLARALATVVARHEVLRTTFETVDGRPVQAIAPVRPLDHPAPLPMVDLAALPGGEREAEAARRIGAEARLPFDLAKGPLLRATLLRLGGEDHAALLTFHHIVADAWSVEVFLREVAACLAAWATREEPALPALPLQYADFAVWQRRWLTGEVLAAELDYWRHQLAGAPRVLALPTDRPRPEMRSPRGATRRALLPAGIVAPLTGWGRERGATLFMILLAAYAAVLGRLAEQEDVVVGSPIAGRDRREIEGLIGFFVNTLALRVDLSGEPAFDALLDRVRAMALGAYGHQSLPFERLVDHLAPARDLGHSPLFQVMLAHQNAPAELRLPGLTLAPLAVDSGTTKADLALTLTEANGALAGAWEFSTELFDAATIDRLSAQLATLLGAIAVDPASRLADLALLSPAERAQLAQPWNAAAKALAASGVNAVSAAPRPAAAPAGRVAPRTAEEAILAEIWAQVLGIERVGVHDNFFDVGGDSILGVQIVARARRAGLWLNPRDLFQHQTVAGLAAVAGKPPAAAASGAVGEEAGEVPLAPIQRWFFGLDLADPSHFNQAVLLAPPAALDARLLERALGEVVARHAALRFRFRRDGAGGWRQVAAPGSVPAPVPIAGVGLGALPPARRRGALEAAAARLQASLDLERGPLLRAARFELGDGGQRLLLVLHHLVVDGFSWRILLGDLEAAYRALAAGEDAALAQVPASFRQWSARLAEQAGSAAVRAELGHWLAAPRGRVQPLPRDRRTVDGTGSVASSRSVVAELAPEETRALLQEVPAAYHSRINDALLAALAEAFAGWTGEPHLLVDLEGHGREDLDGSLDGNLDGSFDTSLDTSRTVGWLTSLYPVLLELDGRARRPGERLMSIKEQLRAVPRGGIGYGLLLYGGEPGGEPEAAARLRALPAAEVVFNYLGQLDRALPEGSLFAPAPESAGEARSPRQRRAHLLEINGGVAAGRLRLTWTYSESVHERATVEALAGRFLAALRDLVEHCRSAEAGGFTASDFPEARLSQKDLEKFMGRLEKRRAAAGRTKAG